MKATIIFPGKDKSIKVVKEPEKETTDYILSVDWDKNPHKGGDNTNLHSSDKTILVHRASDNKERRILPKSNSNLPANLIYLE